MNPFQIVLLTSTLLANRPTLDMTPAGFVHAVAVRTDSLTAWLMRHSSDAKAAPLLRIPADVDLTAGSPSKRPAVVPSGDPQPLTFDVVPGAHRMDIESELQRHRQASGHAFVWLEGHVDARPNKPIRFLLLRAAGDLATMDAKGLYAEIQVQPQPVHRHLILLEMLGGNLSAAQKRDASAELFAAGMSAVPAMITSLEDRRPYSATETVAEHCSALLSALITPAGTDPAPTPDPSQPAMLRAQDWRAFFAARCGRTLEQIRTEMQPWLERYRAQNHTLQIIPR